MEFRVRRWESKDEFYDERGGRNSSEAMLGTGNWDDMGLFTEDVPQVITLEPERFDLIPQDRIERIEVWSVAETGDVYASTFRGRVVLLGNTGMMDPDRGYGELRDAIDQRRTELVGDYVSISPKGRSMSWFVERLVLNDRYPLWMVKFGRPGFGEIYMLVVNEDGSREWRNPLDVAANLVDSDEITPSERLGYKAIRTWMESRVPPPQIHGGRPELRE